MLATIAGESGATNGPRPVPALRWSRAAEIAWPIRHRPPFGPSERSPDLRTRSLPSSPRSVQEFTRPTVRATASGRLRIDGVSDLVRPVPDLMRRVADLSRRVRDPGGDLRRHLLSLTGHRAHPALDPVHGAGLRGHGVDGAADGDQPQDPNRLCGRPEDVSSLSSRSSMCSRSERLSASSSRSSRSRS
jgi:hypothetical protein